MSILVAASAATACRERKAHTNSPALFVDGLRIVGTRSECQPKAGDEVKKFLRHVGSVHCMPPCRLHWVRHLHALVSLAGFERHCNMEEIPKDEENSLEARDKFFVARSESIKEGPQAGILSSFFLLVKGWRPWRQGTCAN